MTRLPDHVDAAGDDAEDEGQCLQARGVVHRRYGQLGADHLGFLSSREGLTCRGVDARCHPKVEGHAAQRTDDGQQRADE